MSRAKCAILIAADTLAPTDSSWISMASKQYRVLSGLGYDVHVLSLGGRQSVLEAEDGTNYDFFVIPRLSYEISMTNSTYTQFAMGKCPIPCFVENYNTTTDDQMGVQDRLSTTPKVQRMSYVGSGGGGTDFEVFGSSYRYDITPAKSAYVDVIFQNEMDKDGVSDQKVCAWRYESQESVNVGTPHYVSCGSGYSYLTFLLHEATIRGDIPAPPTKKQYVIDLDDFPDSINSEAVVTEVHDFLVANDLYSTCGLHGGSGPAFQDNWAKFLTQQVANGGRFYSIDHQHSNDTYHFDWNLDDTGGTMSAMGTVAEKQAEALVRHTGVIDDFIAEGLPIDYATHGWRYFNNNRVSLDGLKVMADLGYKWARLSRESSMELGVGTLDGKGRIAQTNVNFSKTEQYGIKFYTYNGWQGGGNDYIYDSELYITNQGWSVQVLHEKSFDSEHTAFFVHNSDFWPDGEQGKTGGGMAAWKNSVNLVLHMDTIFEHVKNPLHFHTTLKKLSTSV